MQSKRFKKIYIEITNICNLSCPFCMPDGRKKEYMSFENFKQIIEKIKPYTSYIYLHVKGEPLLHPDINEMIEYATNEGLQVNITTNGTKIENLKSKKIRQLNYSIQSSNEIEEIKQILQKMRKYIKGTNIYLSLRLWSNAIKENIEITNMLKQEFNKEVLLDKKELDSNIFLSIEEEFVWPDLNDKLEEEKGYCYGLLEHIAILVDGRVVPCCLDHKGQAALGNIFQQELNEILQSNKAKQMIEGFRNRKVTEELCKKCTFKNKF